MDETTSMIQVGEDAELYAAMPRSLKALLPIVGVANALALVRKAGGTAVYLPRDPNSTHPLVRMLGRQAVDALLKANPSGEIAVPRAVAILRLLRNRQICAARANGTTLKTLAHQFGLSERQISTVTRPSRSKSRPLPKGRESEQ